MLKHKKDYTDYGLLVLRLGIGLMFVYHGFPKITGGPEVWLKLGGTMKFLGITFAPVFWGFMAAIAEFGGGILITLGLFTRMAAFLNLITMIVAVTMKLSTGAGFGGAAEATEMAIVFIALILTGAGRYSLDAKRCKCGSSNG